MLWKVENFHTIIDPEKCVGCGACMEKCPKEMYRDKKHERRDYARRKDKSLPDDYEDHEEADTYGDQCHRCCYNFCGSDPYGGADHEQTAHIPPIEQYGCTDGGYVQQAENNQTDKYPDTQDLITGSTLTPSDLDFGHARRLQQHHTVCGAFPKDNKKGNKRKRIHSTDGKHTLVTNRDGKERMGADQPVPSQARI